MGASGERPLGKFYVRAAGDSTRTDWTGHYAVTCVAAGCAYDTQTPPPPPPTLVNGGFETPTLATHIYRPADAGWVFTGGAGIQRNGSAWGAVAAPEGAQTAFLQGVSAVQLPVDLAAGDYTLSFSVARRAWASPSSARQTLLVTINGVPISSPIVPASTAWQTVTIQINVTSPQVAQLRIEGVYSGDATAFVDDVRLTR